MEWMLARCVKDLIATMFRVTLRVVVVVLPLIFAGVLSFVYGRIRTETNLIRNLAEYPGSVGVGSRYGNRNTRQATLRFDQVGCIYEEYRLEESHSSYAHDSLLMPTSDELLQSSAALKWVTQCVVSIELTGTTINESLASQIASCSTLIELRLEQVRFTEDAFRILCSSKSIRRLCVANIDTGGYALVTLKGLSELEALSVQICVEDLKHFHELGFDGCKKLQVLELTSFISLNTSATQLKQLRLPRTLQRLALSVGVFAGNVEQVSELAQSTVDLRELSIAGSRLFTEEKTDLQIRFGHLRIR